MRDLWQSFIQHGFKKPTVVRTGLEEFVAVTERLRLQGKFMALGPRVERGGRQKGGRRESGRADQESRGVSWPRWASEDRMGPMTVVTVVGDVLETVVFVGAGVA